MPRVRPTLDEIRTWPPTVDLATAAAALGIGRNLAYKLVRAGSFPVRVLPIGRFYKVVVSELIALLEPQSRGGGQTIARP